MSGIQILDCTLRDGGYCNKWLFGEKNIKKISDGLVRSGVEIIELGFLTNRVKYNVDSSQYTTIDKASKMIPESSRGKTFVCMINYGEYDLDDLPCFNGQSIDGIRVAFHKKDMLPALEFCEEIQKKGYKVFVQAMVTLNYSDKEFLDLIYKVNQFRPYAFYIVDSFGVIKKKDLIRLFYMVENNLLETINIGYHSHNNLQLAYSNAQALADIRTKRNMIFDTSVFGMGRGAGNLNTELFVDYLNESYGKKYLIKPILEIIDEIINTFYERSPWGYTLPNYLSAIHNIHPNYASFLVEKKTLTVREMDKIFSSLSMEKGNLFDQDYIERLYKEFLSQKTDNMDESRFYKFLHSLCLL